MTGRGRHIIETLLQEAMYCGLPCGNRGFKVTKGVIDDIGEEEWDFFRLARYVIHLPLHYLSTTDGKTDQVAA